MSPTNQETIGSWLPNTNESEPSSDDYDVLVPLAIIGFSLEYPQDADTPEGFWSVLEEGRDVVTDWPKDRINLDAFFYRDENQEQKKFVPGAHFVKKDLGTFDASFFGISATEAMAMDIQQRKLLEISYHAFENAGLTMKQVYGSKTGVYTGSMSDDYQQILARDIDDLPKYTASGVARAMLANRLSWFYNLHGPSISMDSACSGSLMAFDFACQNLRNRDCNMALVTGSSVILAPDSTLSLMNMSFLSPQGRCHSFDDRADGYSRGEGFGVVLLKRLSDAIRDKNTIRAVVRSTGSNQDGHTPGVTQPSCELQALLIKETYEKAGLSFQDTRYFEAHGTGTPIGDPIEAEAIGRIFRRSRSQYDPLYVGSLKANVGHLEGGSGLAGIIKTVMVLEKATIPPNANLKSLNPRIDADFLNLKFPVECTPWPCDGLRRASVASFGFGGSNSHAVLDDAYHYMKSRRLNGVHATSCHVPGRGGAENFNSDTWPLKGHCTSPVGAQIPDSAAPIATDQADWDTEIHLASTSEACISADVIATTSEASKIIPTGQESAVRRETPTSRILVLSASDEKGIKRLAESYESYFRDHLRNTNDQMYLGHLAYTLSERRSSLQWKSFAVVDSVDSLHSLGSLLSIPSSTGTNGKVVLVFTGQGAQYRNMGSELFAYPTFRATINDFDIQLTKFGCTWSVTNLLQHRDSSYDIDDPEYSQAMTTAVQIGLYELLRTFGVKASLVVGHSSGEIAAAYAAGALDLSSACKVSYFRGIYASALRASTTINPGAMLSVDLSEEKMQDLFELFAGNLAGALHVACINSPYNVTISGDESAINTIQDYLTMQKIFTKKLTTGVAYHSPHMSHIKQEYADSIAKLQMGSGVQHPAMISSVTGTYVRSTASLCTPQYWVDNMLSPVRFSDALSLVSVAVRKGRTRKLGAPKIEARDVVEIGPHAALRRPVTECLEHNGVTQARSRYHSALLRRVPAHKALMKLVGELYASGYPVDIGKANDIDQNPAASCQLLLDLPSYPFNHSRSYWQESTLGKHSRLRVAGKHELLGAPVPDWNSLEPRWRKIFDLAEMPWIGHHQVKGRVIYPAAGMLSMAVQGCTQISDPGRLVSAYQVRDAVFTAPISIDSTERSEVQLHMRLIPAQTDKSLTTLDFRVYSASSTGWFQNCSGTVQILYEKDMTAADSEAQERENVFYRHEYATALERCSLKVPKDSMYSQFRSNGIEYGPSFQPLDNLAWDGNHTSVGRIRCFGADTEYLQHDLQPHVVHPTVIDAAGQLPWVALTKGATEVIVNGFAVTRIQHAWIAASGLSYPETSHLQACSNTSLKGLRGTDSSFFALDQAGKVVMRVSHLETTAVGGDETALDADRLRKICFEMIYKPDLALLDGEQVQKLVTADVQADEPPVSFYEDLELVLFYFTAHALKESQEMLENQLHLQPHIGRYVSWLNHQFSRYHQGNLPHSRPDWIKRIENVHDMESIICRLKETNAEGRFFVEVGLNLPSIIRGFADPLEVIHKSGLAEIRYQEVCETSSFCKQLVNYLDALSHKDPQLRVLEVGAGSGCATGLVLKGLGTRFGRYDYTDSSGSFEDAREKFSSFDLSYKSLDIEVDPARQGYDDHSYDLVVAAWTLHTTRNLASTIRNVCKLLKPGGKLILFQNTQPDTLRAGFVFGTLPEWWLATETHREWSSCISEAQWRQILAENGFKGIDFVLPDYADNMCHENSILVATTAENTISHVAPSKTEITLIVDQQSAQQIDMAKKMQTSFEERGLGLCSIMTWGRLSLTQLTQTTLVFLVELDRPYLSSLDESSFEFLHGVLSRAQKVVWLTSSSAASPQFPECQMVRGLARVLFTERPGLKLATLSFEGPNADIGVYTRCTRQVIQATMADSSICQDLEYVERDGVLHINRVFDSHHVNRTIYSKSHTMTRFQSLEQSPPLALTIQNVGLLDSARWEEDTRYSEELDADEIEIEVQAMGINFRDLLVMLGKYSATAVGCECAGIVTRVGANCKHLRPGDRVCACLIGCSNTHARCHYDAAVKIPDFLATAEAASLPITGVTAYHSIVTLANLQKEDSILIHSATGGTGQMALQIALSVGAEVYVTVGTEEKRALVKELYGIPDDHIFNSRDLTFARDLHRATDGKGVDVVLNSLSKEALLASWECIAPFGRFIELGKMDIENNSRLPMGHFSKNVTFHAVATDHLAIQRPKVAARTLQRVLDMIQDGKIRVASPLQLYPVSELETAFRVMQSGKNKGKMVVTFGRSDVVRTWLKPKFSCWLDPAATYLIAGGLGGLGRSAARWMADRGARNLILLSRSGPKSIPAQDLLTELHGKGVKVSTPMCDVSDPDSLAATLKACSDMPAIRGCLQATMVLQDALFETMTWEQWSISIRSKVASTWNLHNQLPRGLSFFVMLSSVAGIAGSMGQSNYAAGNTFQDGLAAHRVALGERAISIDLGWMDDVGAVAENSVLTRGKETVGDLAPIYEREFLALLEHYLDPDLQISCPEQAQAIIGLVAPSQFRNKGLEPPDWLLDRSLFRGLSREVHGKDGHTTDATPGGTDDNLVAEFFRATSVANAANIVVKALMQRLSKATSTPQEDIDQTRPLNAYGVDSLLAVELRNWFAKVFKADVAIFDITGQASIEKVAEGAAASSTFFKSNEDEKVLQRIEN